MPYTPPSAQSPVSSKSSSPAVSRTSSYHEDYPRSPPAGRHQPPPRSMSSATYLHKHRRSPSLTPTATTPTASNAPPTPTEVPTSSVEITDFATLGSLRQSPPPLNNLRIPTGAVISPPDSSENSDSDDLANGLRGRELTKNWGELQLAVLALPQQRNPSPEKTETVESSQHPPSSELSTKAVRPHALSAEARKISHSRSSTETKIMLKTPTFREESLAATDESEEDDDCLLAKPALVRKKSGELVKPALRPSSRRRYSSMPGTPTYHKSVHFNDSDNQTRHFLQVDKPIAVSAGTSPVEAYDSESEFPFEESKPELGIRVNNFPEDSLERRAKPIRMERIRLSPDKSMLIGTCAVQNLAFQKLVVARFTLDYWNTTSEVVAEYTNSQVTDACDRFTFHIKLTDLANVFTRSMLLCLRYHVGGQDYWDNNNNANYHVDFIKVEPPRSGKSSPRPAAQSYGLGQRPLSAIPRSRHTPPTSRHNSKHESLLLDDDFASRLDAKSAYTFGSPDSLLGDVPTIKLKPKVKRPATSDSQTAPASANAFSSRYDFGSSLSAALSTAQDKLGRGSGLMRKSVKPAAAAAAVSAASASTSAGYFGPIARHPVEQPPAAATQTMSPEVPRPDALTAVTAAASDRPAMGSDQYRDLVQKFCYFTPTPAGKVLVSPLARPSSATTATPASNPNPGVSSTAAAAPASAPAAPLAQPQLSASASTDGAADSTASSSSSPSSSSDSSPAASPMLDGADELAGGHGRRFDAARLSRAGSPAAAGSSSASAVSYLYHHSNFRDANFRDGYLCEPAATPPAQTAIRG